MSAFERVMVNVSSLVVGLSGVIYAWMKYLTQPQDPYAVVNHPLQPWMLDLHVLAAPVMVFAIGLVIQDHILAQIRKGPGRPGRATGLMALACLAPMIATGYLIQVFVEETARRVCVWVHLATGLIYLAAFVAHLIASRRLAARRRAELERAAAAGVSVAAWRRQRLVARIGIHGTSLR